MDSAEFKHTQTETTINHNTKIPQCVMDIHPKYNFCVRKS